MDAAIQNLEYLRKLIAEARADGPGQDAVRLRMLQGYGVGTDAITSKQEDRK